MALLIRTFTLLIHLVMVRVVNGNVVLLGKNISESFNDMEANFTPKIKGSGKCGVLCIADPIDACSPLTNKVAGGSKSSFALIIRGRCSFDDKVRSAENAGFKAAIIYDNEDSGPLIEMGGTAGGVKIHAVFISRASGKVLKKYAGDTDVETWILPTFENTPWSIMVVSFISLLAMFAALATCFFVCKHHTRRERRRAQVEEFHGMSRRLVKAMPSVRFTTVLEDNCTSSACAICLEDYSTGEKLRILPCCHKFHAICVDSWLTAWRTFCPVCKRDARTSINIPPASESTPLLSSGAPTPSSVNLLSCHSSLASSPSIPIASSSPPVSMLLPPWIPPASRNHSLSNIHNMVNSYSSYITTSSIHINRSFVDLRNTPTQRSAGLRYSSNASPSYLVGSSGQCSYLRHCESRASISASASASGYSVGLPLPSPHSSRFMNHYNASSSNASPSFLVGSSGRCSYLRYCESGASISALASAQSLPTC